MMNHVQPYVWAGMLAAIFCHDAHAQTANNVYYSQKRSVNLRERPAATIPPQAMPVYPTPIPTTPAQTLPLPAPPVSAPIPYYGVSEPIDRGQRREPPTYYVPEPPPVAAVVPVAPIKPARVAPPPVAAAQASALPPSPLAQGGRTIAPPAGAYRHVQTAENVEAQRPEPVQPSRQQAAQNRRQSDAARNGWQEYIPTTMRNVSARSAEPSFRAKIYTGYRKDTLDWNLSGNIAGQNPNVLSELTWDDVRLFQVGAQAEYTHKGSFLKDVHVDGHVSFGGVFSGDVQDSDFSQDGRVDEFSRSNNDASEGDAINTKVGFGYEFNTGTTSPYYSWITPMVGYSYSELNVVMQDLFQTIPAAGPFSGLDSEYNTEWDGPFLALKGGMKFGKHRVAARGEYHLSDYKGVGRWNLRSEFAQPVSFIHNGEASGLAFEAEYSYAIWNNFDVFLNAAYQTWNVEDGTDILIFGNGLSTAQRLNEVNWDSQAYNIGIAYNF